MTRYEYRIQVKDPKNPVEFGSLMIESQWRQWSFTRRFLYMLKYREITEADNDAVAALIRNNLKKVGLDIPGTVYRVCRI